MPINLPITWYVPSTGIKAINKLDRNFFFYQKIGQNYTIYEPKKPNWTELYAVWLLGFIDSDLSAVSPLNRVAKNKRLLK